MLHLQPSLAAHNPRMNVSHFSHDLPHRACPILLHACVHFDKQFYYCLALSHKLPMQLSHCLSRMSICPHTCKVLRCHAFATPMPQSTLVAGPQPTRRTCLAFVLAPKHAHIATTTWHKALSQAKVVDHHDLRW